MLFGLVVPLLLVPSRAGSSNRIPGSVYGDFKTRVTYSLQHGVTAKGGIKVTLPFTAEFQGNPRVILGLDNVSARTNQNQDGDYEDDIFTFSTSVRLRVSSARIESHGPLWLDGPEVRFRAGEFYTNYSDWVARSIGRRGVELYDLPIGPNTLRLHYGFPNEWFALRLDGGVNEQTARLVALHRPADSGDDYETDAHLYMRLGSARGTYTAVNLAQDGTSGAGAFEVERVRRMGRTALGSIRMWNVSEAFAPPRARRNRDGETVAFAAGQVGVEARAERTMGDLTYGTRLTYAVPIATPSPVESWAVYLSHDSETKVNIEIERVEQQVSDPAYLLRLQRDATPDGVDLLTIVEWDKQVTSWMAEAAKDVTVGAQPVEISLTLLGTEGPPALKTQAQWDAPNGFRMGVHYATHDSDAFGLDPIDRHPAGLYITASVSMEF